MSACRRHYPGRIGGTDSSIPGVGQLSAATILAETGPDLDSFPTIEQMASWAGLCPGNRESAGIQKGPQTTHGNPYLCTALVQCAWAATRKRDSVFRSRFQRLAPRRGEKRAIIAVAHHMLIILYSLNLVNLQLQFCIRLAFT